MQVYSKPVGEAFTLVYVVNFDIRCNAKMIRDAFEGDFYQLNLPKGCSPRLTTHLLHFIGTRMGGPSLTDITLTEPDKKPTKSRAYWKEGFAFIKKHGPMGTDLNQNVEWTQYQIHDPASPIFNWPAGLVKESLRNLTSGKSTAASHSIYPLTLRDVKTHILQTIAIPYIKISAEHGLFLLGRSGIGKTPFSRILALALSDFNIQRDQVEDKEPSYQCGNDLDFFRSSPGLRSKEPSQKKYPQRKKSPRFIHRLGRVAGTIYEPAIYDDGAVSEDNPAHLKIFLDPAEEEAACRSRWGSSRWDKNQARIVCANPFDQEAEPTVINEALGINHEQFMRMVRVALPRSGIHEDLQAICKRALFVLFGRTRMYIRHPSPEVNVRCQHADYWPAHEKADLLCPSGIDKLKAIRSGDGTPPPSYMADRQWQVEFIRRVLIGEPVYIRFFERNHIDDTGIRQGHQYVDEKPDLKHDDDTDNAIPDDDAHRLCGTELAFNPHAGQAAGSHGYDGHVALAQDPYENIAEEPNSKKAKRHHDTVDADEPSPLESALAAELEALMGEAPTFNNDDPNDIVSEPIIHSD